MTLLPEIREQLLDGAFGAAQPRAGAPRTRGLGRLGLGLAVAVPVLVAVLAVVLLGHKQPASPTRPAHPKPAPGHSSHPVRLSSIDAALARGIRPPAPDATVALPVLGSSASRSIESFRGKVVVLNVFASWCEPCKAQTAVLEQAQAVIAGQGATVLGVTYEDKPVATGSVRTRHAHHLSSAARRHRQLRALVASRRGARDVHHRSSRPDRRRIGAVQSTIAGSPRHSGICLPPSISSRPACRSNRPRPSHSWPQWPRPTRCWATASSPAISRPAACLIPTSSAKVA